MTLEIKALQGAQIKAMDEEGKGLAVIATLNVIDKDGDVTLPGAFGQQVAKIVPAHDWSHVPLGKTSISESGDEVLAEFQINMGLDSGQQWHKALKFDLENPPALQEWSYGFMIADASFGDFQGQSVRFLKALKVHEISPVLLGAGVNTRTVAMKGHMKFADEVQKVANDLQTVIARADDIKQKREADGRDMSPERYAELEGICDTLAKLLATRDALKGLLQRGGDCGEAEKLFAEMVIGEQTIRDRLQ